MQAQCGCIFRVSAINSIPFMPGRFLSASRQPKPSARILSTAASALPTELTLRPFMGRTLESTSTTMGSSSTTRTVSGKFITSVSDMFPPAQAPTPLYRGQAAMQVCDFAVDVRQDEGRWWQVGSDVSWRSQVDVSAVFRVGQGGRAHYRRAGFATARASPGIITGDAVGFGSICRCRGAVGRRTLLLQQLRTQGQKERVL